MAIIKTRNMIFYATGILLLILGILTWVRGYSYLMGGLETHSYMIYLFGFIPIILGNSSPLLVPGLIMLAGVVLMVIPKVKKWQ